MTSNTDDRGIKILKRAAQAVGKEWNIIQDVICTTPILKDFATKIEKGQKLVLDISKETIEKIQKGELKIMETKEGVLKAEICTPNGVIKQHMDLKYEDICNIEDPTAFSNMVQMANMRNQLQEIVDQLESLGIAVQSILMGQQNDRIALYRSGEQLYLEAKVIKDNIIKQQLIVSALKSLEDARMQMIENIITDISTIVSYDNKEIKMKSNELKEVLERINLSFDVINRASFLKAGIYYEQEETEAMMLTLKKYASFLNEQINKNANLLYQYDTADMKIKGKWHERSKNIPQKIDILMNKYNMSQQLLEVDYQTLNDWGIVNESEY